MNNRKTGITGVAATVPNSTGVSNAAEKDPDAKEKLRGTKGVMDVRITGINNTNAAAKKQKQQPAVEQRQESNKSFKSFKR